MVNALSKPAGTPLAGNPPAGNPLAGNPTAGNPLAGNPLKTRGDAQRAVVDLVDPLVPFLEQQGAMVRLGVSGATFDLGAEALEGVARPLWGLVPLAAGGGTFEHWDLWPRGAGDQHRPGPRELLGSDPSN